MELHSFIGELRLEPYGLRSHEHLFERAINMEGDHILWWPYEFPTNEHCWHWRVTPHAPQSPLHFPPIGVLVKLMHRRACSKLIEQLRDAVAHVTWTLGEYNCCLLWCQVSYSIHYFKLWEKGNWKELVLAVRSFANCFPWWTLWLHRLLFIVGGYNSGLVH